MPYMVSGFALIELGIVLVITALLLGAGLLALNGQLEGRRISTTLEKSEAIQIALRNFMARNGRLPCPALGDLVPSASGYGVEAEAKEAVVASPGPPPVLAAPSICVGATVAGGGYVGVVPWITLGLPNEAVNDGWDRRFTYQVSKDGIFSGGSRRTVEYASLARGDIAVHGGTPIGAGVYDAALNPSGTQINGCSKSPADTNTCNNYAIVVVVSHGKNGLGAWQENGIRLGLPAVGAVERLNADDNSIYLKVQYLDSGNAQHFDDFVLAITPNDLLNNLVASGQVRSEPVALRTSLDEIKYWIIAEAARTRFVSPPPVPTVTYELPVDTDALYLAKAPSSGLDPWGNRFDYTSPLPLSTHSKPSFDMATAGNAYTLQSPGPDGDLATTADNPPPVDVRVEELREILLKNGL